MNTSWPTLEQAASEAGSPVDVFARYMKWFPEFFPVVANGETVRCHPECVHVVRLIEGLYEIGKSDQEIRGSLKDTFASLKHLYENPPTAQAAPKDGDGRALGAEGGDHTMNTENTTARLVADLLADAQQGAANAFARIEERLAGLESRAADLSGAVQALKAPAPDPGVEAVLSRLERLDARLAGIEETVNRLEALREQSREIETPPPFESESDLVVLVAGTPKSPAQASLTADLAASPASLIADARLIETPERAAVVETSTQAGPELPVEEVVVQTIPVAPPADETDFAPFDSAAPEFTEFPEFVAAAVVSAAPAPAAAPLQTSADEPLEAFAEIEAPPVEPVVEPVAEPAVERPVELVAEPAKPVEAPQTLPAAFEPEPSPEPEFEPEFSAEADDSLAVEPSLDAEAPSFEPAPEPATRPRIDAGAAVALAGAGVLVEETPLEVPVPPFEEPEGRIPEPDFAAPEPVAETEPVQAPALLVEPASIKVAPAEVVTAEAAPEAEAAPAPAADDLEDVYDLAPETVADAVEKTPDASAAGKAEPHPAPPIDLLDAIQPDLEPEPAPAVQSAATVAEIPAAKIPVASTASPVDLGGVVFEVEPEPVAASDQPAAAVRFEEPMLDLGLVAEASPVKPETSPEALAPATPPTVELADLDREPTIKRKDAPVGEEFEILAKSDESSGRNLASTLDLRDKSEPVPSGDALEAPEPIRLDVEEVHKRDRISGLLGFGAEDLSGLERIFAKKSRPDGVKGLDKILTEASMVGDIPTGLEDIINQTLVKPPVAEAEQDFTKETSAPVEKNAAVLNLNTPETEVVEETAAAQPTAALQFNEYNEPTTPPKTRADIKRVIWYMRKRGCPLSQIADYLALERVPTLAGKGVWDDKLVDAVIKALEKQALQRRREREAAKLTPQS